ncbi:MAG: ATP-binding protein [Cellvibrio sp.]|uniref:ATP-binding protein n=1 Tax=Cellvibrio sp. TaxID=1965322 RepID=UPI0031A6C123
MDQGNLLIPREQLTEEQLDAALQECANEPIHIPNCIQPHGLMLVTNDTSEEILQVSENVIQHLGISAQDCIGKHLADVIGAENLQTINEAIREADLAPYKFTSVELAGKPYDAVVHFSRHHKVFEFEPKIDGARKDTLQKVYEDLRNYSIEAQKTYDVDSLYHLIVAHVRNITGFDRVKLYKFDEAWNGAVVAEDRADYMPSYLGLNFPASDIPEQARRLYSINYLRLIPDIRYRPSPLYPQMIEGARKPLDMSYAVLRSVSPIHIQYLENINVEASMSISIMQDNKLWGLIACHHKTSLHIPHSIRVLCEIIAHIFSAKLTTMRRSVDNQRHDVRKLLIEKLSLTSSMDTFENTITKNSEIALQALDADGIAIFSGGKFWYFGETFEQEYLERLAAWYRAYGNKAVVHTSFVGDYFQHDEVLKDLTGGLLFVPIGVYSEDIAIWFRKAKTESVNWAGNPEKPVEQTKAGYRLTPRSSFELWQTTIQGRSKNWSLLDIETAESIAQILLENSKIQSDIANKAKTDFLSHMSHELRTPLGAIISIIQVLNRDNTLTVDQRKLIYNLEVSSDSLFSLINDLLDISKIEANEYLLEVAPFKVAELVEDVRSIMSVKATEKNLQLGINYLETKDLVFQGDKTKIKQILFNLVNNAIKFTERGFVNLFASVTDSEHPEIKILTVEVIDSGIGIDESKLVSIFEKFIQADSSTARIYGGTGLGLSICKSIVSLMGGEIDVTSKPGLGSNFKVSLPLPCKQAQSNEVELLGSEHTLTDKIDSKDRLKILVAEDYEGNIIAVLDYLQSEGCDVVIAKNGEIAVKYYQSTNFDIILMDVQMPRMDGLTATRIIKEMETKSKKRPTPILGMTANALKEDRDRCMAAGMDDYISKPMRLDELSTKIKRLVENNRKTEVESTD